MMKRVLPIVLAVATVVFIWIAWVQSGGIERHRMFSARSPEEAVRLLLTAAKSRNWDAAYSRLANAGEVEKAAFARDLGGSNGSLRTYATLENFNVWGLHADNQEATVRAKLHYSTAVGPLDDVRDIKVRNDGSGSMSVQIAASARSDTWKPSSRTRTMSRTHGRGGRPKESKKVTPYAFA